ncbi:MAG: glycoside hydrolase family 1 protein [Anaerolineae bacterium]|nr:glycoside hydrolase family 1 protein [Anaerolineae bacterium]
MNPYQSSAFDLDLNGFRLPDGFLFGVCNSPYHSEGGYNTEAGPHNNWSAWEHEGLTERSGETNRFWTDYLPHLRKAHHTGLNAFRMGIDWARLQPSSSPYEAPEPAWDEAALDRYAEIIAAVWDHDMKPIITLHHFTHPAWLGAHLWTDPAKIAHFRAYVRRAVEGVNVRLVSANRPPIPFFVVFNEPFNTLAGPYLFGDAPPGGIRNDGASFSAATVNLLAAYARAYDLIHDLYAAHGWPAPQVGFNIVSYCIYELDKWYLDVCRARSLKVARQDVPAYLEANKAAFYAAMSPLVTARLDDFQQGYWRKCCYDYGKLFAGFDLSPLLDAIYDSPRLQKLDYIAIDCYDPLIFCRVTPDDLYPFKPPAPIGADRFDWEKLLFDPDVTREHLRLHGHNLTGLPLYILETNTGHNQPLFGAAVPRADGMTRAMFLRDILIEAVRLLQLGAPLQGFLYWTLCDNYEWGTHRSRLGLVEYDYGRHQIGDTDAFGLPMLDIYRDLIGALQSGDAARIRTVFCDPRLLSPANDRTGP